MTLSVPTLSRVSDILSEIRDPARDPGNALLAAQIVLLQDIRALLQPVEAGVRAVADHILRAESRAEPLCDDLTGEEEVAVSIHLPRETWEALALLAPLKGSYPVQLMRDVGNEYGRQEKSPDPKTPLDLLKLAIFAAATARDATTQGFADDHCANALKELWSAVKWESLK